MVYLYGLASKRKGILTHATTWMKTSCYNVDEDITLSESVSHERRDTILPPLEEVPRMVTFMGTGSRMVVDRGGGREEGEGRV